jgi:hypothetical protein
VTATRAGLVNCWRRKTADIDHAAPDGKAAPEPSAAREFPKIGVPTEEQAKAYIAMLSSTASLKGDVAAGSIFDFSLAAEAARELAQKK